MRIIFFTICSVTFKILESLKSYVKQNYRTVTPWYANARVQILGLPYVNVLVLQYVIFEWALYDNWEGLNKFFRLSRYVHNVISIKMNFSTSETLSQRCWNENIIDILTEYKTATFKYYRNGYPSIMWHYYTIMELVWSKSMNAKHFKNSKEKNMRTSKF